MTALLDLYAQALATKKLQPDTAQQHAIAALDDVITGIIQPPIKKLFRAKPHAAGMYLHGAPGRGKTMMMQWAMDVLIQHDKRVNRVHFHKFMLDVHHALRDLAVHDKNLDNRLTALADQWADDLDVLCFDEFHVTDVADAMIMMPLFDRFFARRLVVIATSNWAPDDLYSGGLQRSRFVPFIARLKKNWRVVDVSGDKDYRTANAATLLRWLQPLNDDTAAQFGDQFTRSVGYDPIETHEIHVGKRTLTLPRASRQNICLDLDQFLQQPLGAADFMALAARYKIVFLDHLRVFHTDHNERAKRFMVLIDALYDADVKLIVRSDVAIADLYPPQGALAFEFARTQSRLQQMTATTT